MGEPAFDGRFGGAPPSPHRQPQSLGRRETAKLEWLPAKFVSTSERPNAAALLHTYVDWQHYRCCAGGRFNSKQLSTDNA